jgi:hypothetical protein
MPLAVGAVYLLYEYKSTNTDAEALTNASDEHVLVHYGNCLWQLKRFEEARGV